MGDQLSISPTFINAFHVTFSRLANNRADPPDMPSPVGIGVNMFNFYPHFIDLSVTNHFSIGGGCNAPAFFIRDQWQYADDIDWIRGRNHFSFGVDFIALQMNEVNVQFSNGEFAFNGSQTNDALTDFLLGRPNSLTDSNVAQIGMRQKYTGLYLQDDVKITKRVNVHFGVRWEPFLPEADIAGRGNHFSTEDFIAGKRTSLYTNAPPGLLFHGDPGIPAAYTNNG